MTAVTLTLITLAGIINSISIFWIALEVIKQKKIQKGVIDILLANVNKGSIIKIDLETFKAIINAK